MYVYMYKCRCMFFAPTPGGFRQGTLEEKGWETEIGDVENKPKTNWLFKA